tara:strand:- start:248 stop:1732 length:1485 start_codon:yes stop_codon:yes gene_type:complete
MASSICGQTIQPIKTVLPIKKGPAIEEVPNEEVPKINNLEPKKSFEPNIIEIKNVISPSEIQAQEDADHLNEELASIENKKSLQEIQAQERADYNYAVELMNKELANIYGGYDNIPEFNKDAFNEDNQDLKKNLKGNSADPFEQNEIQAILFTKVILDSPEIDNSVLPEPVQNIVSKKLDDVKVNVDRLGNYSQFTQEVNEYCNNANNRLNRHQVREFSIPTVKASGLEVKSPSPPSSPPLSSRSISSINELLSVKQSKIDAEIERYHNDGKLNDQDNLCGFIAIACSLIQASSKDNKLLDSVFEKLAEFNIECDTQKKEFCYDKDKIQDSQYFLGEKLYLYYCENKQWYLPIFKSYMESQFDEQKFEQAREQDPELTRDAFISTGRKEEIELPAFIKNAIYTNTQQQIEVNITKDNLNREVLNLFAEYFGARIQLYQLGKGWETPRSDDEGLILLKIFHQRGPDNDRGHYEAIKDEAMGIKSQTGFINFITEE